MLARKSVNMKPSWGTHLNYLHNTSSRMDIGSDLEIELTWTCASGPCHRELEHAEDLFLTNEDLKFNLPVLFLIPISM